MSVEVCPTSISHLPHPGFSNESILSVMTVAYMQNGVLPNGTAVVSEAPEKEWVVQKFGGESVIVCARALNELLNAIRYQCGQIPGKHSTRCQVRFPIRRNMTLLILFTGQDFTHHLLQWYALRGAQEPKRMAPRTDYYELLERPRTHYPPSIEVSYRRFSQIISEQPSHTSKHPVFFLFSNMTLPRNASLSHGYSKRRKRWVKSVQNQWIKS